MRRCLVRFSTLDVGLETTHVIINLESKSDVDDATVVIPSLGASKAIPGKPLKADHKIPPPPGCELISLLGSGGMGTVFVSNAFESAGGGQDSP